MNKSSQMVKYFYYTFLVTILINCSSMNYQPVTQEEISQSGLRLDGLYFSYKRIPEVDSTNKHKKYSPEFDPAHLSIYMFSKEGKAVYRGIMAEMWQIPGSNVSEDNDWIFEVLFHRLGWKKSDLLQEYKKTESYSLKGQKFSLTSYNRKKIYQYTRECQILDDSKIVIDRDTFKFKKYYANYNTLLEKQK